MGRARQHDESRASLAPPRQRLQHYRHVVHLEQLGCLGRKRRIPEKSLEKKPAHSHLLIYRCILCILLAMEAESLLGGAGSSASMEQVTALAIRRRDRIDCCSG
jgi:hypothetical protein